MATITKTLLEMEMGRRMVALNRAEDAINLIMAMFNCNAPNKNWFSGPHPFPNKWSMSSYMTGNQTVMIHLWKPGGEKVTFEEPILDFPSDKLMAQLRLIAP